MGSSLSAVISLATISGFPNVSIVDGFSNLIPTVVWCEWCLCGGVLLRRDWGIGLGLGLVLGLGIKWNGILGLWNPWTIKLLNHQLIIVLIGC